MFCCVSWALTKICAECHQTFSPSIHSPPNTLSLVTSKKVYFLTIFYWERNCFSDTKAKKSETKNSLKNKYFDKGEKISAFFFSFGCIVFCHPPNCCLNMKRLFTWYTFEIGERITKWKFIHCVLKSFRHKSEFAEKALIFNCLCGELLIVRNALVNCEDYCEENSLMSHECVYWNLKLKVLIKIFTRFN